MRRTTSIVTASIVAALLAGIVLAACGSRQPDQPSTNALATATTVAPTTTPSAARTATTQQADARGTGGGAPPWGTDPKGVDAPPISTEIYNVRSAGHDRYDRVVFDLNGLANQLGYEVRYVPLVHADPSDKPIHVAGGAALQVTIQAPDFRESGHQPWRTPWQLGQRLAGQQSVLKEVRFAGTFEHVTTFALGVGSERPFRVLVVPDSGSHVTHLVVDVAR
ncbi:MAG TPA: hypothetical protein VF486_17925 [Actinomycetes bacterium]